jgi:hypothetical protein
MNQPAKCVYQDKEGDLKSQRLRSIPWILVNNFYDGCTGHKEGKATQCSSRASIECSRLLQKPTRVVNYSE